MLCLNLQSADLFSFAIVIQVHNNRHICIYTDKYIYTCTRSQNHRISWDRRGTKVKSKFWTAKDFAKHNGQYRYSINEDWELKKLKKKTTNQTSLFILHSLNSGLEAEARACDTKSFTETKPSSAELAHLFLLWQWHPLLTVPFLTFFTHFNF